MAIGSSKTGVRQKVERRVVSDAAIEFARPCSG
jgi:hypothetical protein